MKRMRNAAALMVCAAMACSVFGCSDSTKDTTKETEEETTTTVEEEEEDETDDTVIEDDHAPDTDPDSDPEEFDEEETEEYDSEVQGGDIMYDDDLGDTLMTPGELYFFGTRNEDAIRGLSLSGDRTGDEINYRVPATTGIRDVFEMNEWVEIYLDSDSDDLTAYVVDYNQDWMQFDSFSIDDAYVYTVVELTRADDADQPWGSFYMNPEEADPGFYHLVFEENGNVIAAITLRFFAEGDLDGYTDADLEPLEFDAFYA